MFCTTSLLELFLCHAADARKMGRPVVSLWRWGVSVEKGQTSSWARRPRSVFLWKENPITIYRFTQIMDIGNRIRLTLDRRASSVGGDATPIVYFGSCCCCMARCTPLIVPELATNYSDQTAHSPNWDGIFNAARLEPIIFFRPRV